MAWAEPLRCPILDEAPKHLSDVTSWHGHVPFAFYAMWALRPRSLVELGTHKGDSYLAFCQAAQALGLPTRCMAVDTWQGDPHAGFYGPEVLAELRAHHAPYEAFSTLRQATFDEAAATVPFASVDLLHIDGLHTYDAVRHDFDTWFPKMRAPGLVLLHDTEGQDRGFEVHRLLGELGERFPTFRFHHSFGLGVVLVGDPATHPLGWLARLGPEEAEGVRRLFAIAGARIALQGTAERHAAHVRHLQDKLAATHGQVEAARQAAAEWERHAHANAAATQEAERRAAAAQAEATRWQHLLAGVRATRLGRLMERTGRWRF